jgi:lipopolysaccharide/colanic/teichoic acid biosynthesis glycosyltransferase
VIFRQERVGRDGGRFDILKFRSLTPATDLESAARWDISHDDRVGRVGRLIRRTSLDELPQLVNVLRGEMTLVGPRPELVEIVLNYQPWQHRRHTVKPGVTGLWQISGHRDGLMHEHVELDLEYIDQMSFKTDMKIMVRTIGAVLRTSLGC